MTSKSGGNLIKISVDFGTIMENKKLIRQTLKYAEKNYQREYKLNKKFDD